jgi:hypothetical protein
VSGAASESTPGSRGTGATSGHQTGRTGGTLGGRGDPGRSTPAQALSQAHFGGPPVDPVSAAAAVHPESDLGAVCVFGLPTPASEA